MKKVNTTGSSTGDVFFAFGPENSARIASSAAFAFAIFLLDPEPWKVCPSTTTYEASNGICESKVKIIFGFLVGYNGWSPMA